MPLLLVIVFYKLFLRLFDAVIIPGNAIGVVRKQSRALANTQAQVVDAERSVQIADYHAQSVVKKAKGEAEAKTTNAAADAQVTTVTGSAEAGRIKAVGEAEAEVLKKKVESVDPQYYAAMDIFRNLATSQLKLVPEIAVAGGSGTGGPLDVLLAMALRDGVRKDKPPVQ